MPIYIILLMYRLNKVIISYLIKSSYPHHKNLTAIHVILWKDIYLHHDIFNLKSFAGKGISMMTLLTLSKTLPTFEIT